MSAQRNPHAVASRDQARARLRTLTNATLLAATGATVGIAVVVAHEHPGKSAASTTTSGQSTTGSTGTSGSSDDTGDTGNTGSSTGNTGNSGSSSFSPSISSQAPSVTSGGSAVRR